MSKSKSIRQPSLITFLTQWRSHLLKCDTVLCNLELRTFLAPTCLFFRLLHISLLTGFTSLAKVILAVTPCCMPASSLLKMSITEYSWSLLEEVRSTVLTTVGNVTFDVDMLLPGGHETLWINMLWPTWAASVFGKRRWNFCQVALQEYRSASKPLNDTLFLVTSWTFFSNGIDRMVSFRKSLPFYLANLVLRNC